MKIAIEGCCHGELDKIYETVLKCEEKSGIKVDLLLICGDFQAVRNFQDLQTMAVPPKYRQMNSFYKYYSGEAKAPVLTVFIGGNHEASAYLQELPYGGWVAENIYYMGYSGVININGVRIAGLSGIYKDYNFHRGHFEHPPYDEKTLRSCYHIRNIDVFRLKQIRKKIDIFLSHDWPQGIYDYGDVVGLLHEKKYFREEVETGTLGSPVGRELLFKLKPQYWFAAHLHCKFSAVVGHLNEAGLPDGETKFLSLDKCLPHRKFLQIIEVQSSNNDDISISLDAEWMSILKSTNDFFSLSPATCFLPDEASTGRYDFSASESDMKEVAMAFNDDFKVPKDFRPTAPPLLATDRPNERHSHISLLYLNEQTVRLCAKLDLINPYGTFLKNIEDRNRSFSANDSQLSDGFQMSTSNSFLLEKSQNPDEISLDDEDCADGEPNTTGDRSVSSPFNLQKALDVSEKLFSDDKGDTKDDGDDRIVQNESKVRGVRRLSEESDDEGNVNTSGTKPDLSYKSRSLKRRNVAMYSILNSAHENSD
ncbi:hypothetical protein HELRODRAFT_185863 [Helobdella robusta]|uniref:Lariat debranching enzyme C-terminal domain-containing protein n=1 Tax=Helobdella robusta TaxID=6412 RepID=T1FND3_HELRO|nr:hypothetical protein HELRODRAFT_185863 [Helobdella robusta]ESN98308.1 hypothetical protein HELRODRAFT_185863 [Helobdella robusta]